MEQLTRLRQLLAIELVCAAQAVDLAGPERLGAGTGAAYARVRELVAPLDDDRAMGPELERLAKALFEDSRLVWSGTTQAEQVTG
jgi:histidine ammonia-lyase